MLTDKIQENIRVNRGVIPKMRHYLLPIWCNRASLVTKGELPICSSGECLDLVRYGSRVVLVGPCRGLRKPIC
jgi:hypothetical protein